MLRSKLLVVNPASEQILATIAELTGGLCGSNLGSVITAARSNIDVIEALLYLIYQFDVSLIVEQSTIIREIASINPRGLV